MAMPSALHKVLKESLVDKTYDEKPVLDFISEIYAQYEAADKIKKANEDHIKEREELKTKNKEYKEIVDKKDKELKDMGSEIEKLKTSQLSDEERKQWIETKKKGMTSDAEAEFNRLKATVEELNAEIKTEAQKRIDAEKRSKESTYAGKRTELETKIYKALSDKGINGSDADMAIAVIEKQGLFKLDETETGFAEKFFVKGDKGEPLSASISELADYMATKHENLVKSSGNRGSGINHSSAPNNSIPQSGFGNLMATRNTARQLMERDFKK